MGSTADRKIGALLVKWTIKGAYIAAEIGFGAYRQSKGKTTSSAGATRRIGEFNKMVDKAFQSK